VHSHQSLEATPIISDVALFDRNSGSLLERLLFNNRRVVLVLSVVATVILGMLAAQVRLNASFVKMIPTEHEFIRNFLDHQEELRSQGNAIRIAAAARGGTIIDADYIATLQKLSDEIYLLPGVDRAFMTSLWTPTTRWLAVTEDGLESGPVFPEDYDGSPAGLETVRRNIERTGRVGELVAGDFSSSAIFVPLYEHDNTTGEPLDYGHLSATLEELRTKYAAQGIDLHIVGFGKVVGELIAGVVTVLEFFSIAILLATALLYWYTRCVRSTLLVVFCSLVAVLWQLGFLPLLGFDLDPYSVLVPFLIFAIGMSHGAQKMNGVLQDIGRGAHRFVAARYTFRRLFLAGFTALMCDAIGFAVLLIIRIEVIFELALVASIGVAILIFTNLILLPVLLSFVGVSSSAARRSITAEIADETVARHPLWAFLDLFTRRRYAAMAVAAGLALGIGGWTVGRHAPIGDIDPGAPELRRDSVYNRDNAYIIQHYSTSSDTLVLMVDVPESMCTQYDTLVVLDDLEWRLRQMPEVESTSSLASFSRLMIQWMTEASPKWYELVRNQAAINDFSPTIPRSLKNFACSFLPFYVSLRDHKAETLRTVISRVEAFVNDPRNQGPNFRILLAGGNAGIEAATNEVITVADREMLLWVYGAVAIFCYISFRSWRSVVCAILPLILTSVLAQAIMVWMGIGIKVATLPVIALGVGIGVDYALYILSVTLVGLRRGESLSTAYFKALLFTGKVVLLTGVTLAIGVVTWVAAPIKFQADMGILLSFMFIWNMLGALILLPALVYFLKPVRGSTTAVGQTGLAGREAA
jgi:hypothetical protein